MKKKRMSVASTLLATLLGFPIAVALPIPVDKALVSAYWCGPPEGPLGYYRRNWG